MRHKLNVDANNQSVGRSFFDTTQNGTDLGSGCVAFFGGYQSTKIIQG